MEWMLKYVLLIFLVWRLTLAGQYWKQIDELVLFVMADIHISQFLSLIDLHICRFSRKSPRIHRKQCRLSPVIETGENENSSLQG